MDLETVSNRFEEHFRRVKAAPTTDWLQPGVVTDENENSSGYRSYTTLDTSENIKAWLLRPSENLSLSSKGDELNDERISLSRHSSVEEKGSENYVGGEYAGSENGWLLVEKRKEKSDGDSAEDQATNDWLNGLSTPQITRTWLQRFHESTGTTTSDWLIEYESEANPECYEWLTQDSINRCKDCSGQCDRDTFKVFKNVLNSSRSEWLATASDW